MDLKSHGIQFNLMSRCCDQCLTTPRKIVDDVRRDEILARTRRNSSHFVCHKGSNAGRNIACRGHHELVGGCVAYRIASAFGRVALIDPQTLKEIAP